MLIEQNIKPFTKFYALCMVLYTLAMYDVTWISNISFSTTRLFIIIVCLIKFFNAPLTIERRSVFPVLLLFLYCFYSFVFTHFDDKWSSIRYLSLFVSMTSIILLSSKEKKYLLKVFTDVFVVVLVISLFGWILFLMGVNLPHTGVIFHWNGFHEYYNYYFFRVATSSVEGIFPRFQSVFLEPGQLGTPCAFLLFLNAFENKVFGFKNLIFIAAILFSLSLISYGLLLVTLAALAWLKNSNYRVLFTIIVILLIGSGYYYVSSSGDNAINVLILERLEYDEELGIAGNNRTANVFDSNYSTFIKSNDKYFGIHSELSSGYDWTTNSSGYKKFIVHEGIVGLIVFLSFFVCLLFRNRNSKTLVFLIIVVTAFFVRNLLQSPLWLSITILGFYLLGNENQQIEESNSFHT